MRKHSRLLKRDTRRFLHENAYIDRQKREVISLVGNEEILDMIRKKYPTLRISKLSINRLMTEIAQTDIVSVHKVEANFYLARKKSGKKELIVLTPSRPAS